MELVEMHVCNNSCFSCSPGTRMRERGGLPEHEPPPVGDSVSARSHFVLSFCREGWCSEQE